MYEIWLLSVWDMHCMRYDASPPRTPTPHLHLPPRTPTPHLRHTHTSPTYTSPLPNPPLLHCIRENNFPVVGPLSYQTFNLNYGSLTFVSVMCMHETLRPLRCNTPTAGEAMRGSFDGGCIAALLSLTLNSWKFFPCYKHSNFLDFQPIPREFRYSVLASLEPRLLHSQPKSTN